MRSASDDLEAPSSAAFKADLHQSDRFSDNIQSIGGLVILSADDANIVGCSQNIEHVFDVAPESLVGRSMLECVQSKHRSIIEECLASLDHIFESVHIATEHSITTSERTFELIAHRKDHHRFLEFLPRREPSQPVRRLLLRVGQLSRQIEQAKTYEEALELTTTGVQSLFGYDDVALYRASADGTYSITAESTTSAPSRAKPSSSWRCMWEPELFVTKEMPWRCVAGRSQPTIPIIYTDRLEIQPDLSHVLLLAANEEQSVYLQNVQAESVTAMALIHEGIVWGILNAHCRTSRFPPFEERALVQQIGDALLRRHADEEQNLSAAIKRQLKNIQNPTADNIQSTGSSPQMLSRVIPRVHTLIEADGFAIQYADRLFTVGRVPSDSFIFELHKWIDQSPSAFEQFVCTRLSDLYPKARANSELACAVLTQSSFIHSSCHATWFRAKTGPTFTWADRRAAPLLLRQIMDVLTSYLLAQEQTLQLFATKAAHDIKAPLRGIQIALDIMVNERLDADAVQESYELASSAIDRLRALTGSLLDIHGMQTQHPAEAAVELNAVVRDAVALHKLELVERRGRVDVEPLPTVWADHDLLVRAVSNLIDNSIKYATDEPQISIAARQLDGKVELCITDNGPGIPAQSAISAFEPLVRLNTKVRADGSGLGLTICKTILQSMGGSIRLDTGYTFGARFIMQLRDGPR